MSSGITWGQPNNGVTWNAPPGSAPGGAYSQEEIQRLWVKAGGDPRYAKIMARVADAESSGRNDAHNQYEEGGHTYHVKGLWQISDIHGQANYADPMTNARKAVELFNAQGFSPWAASKPHWGKYVADELMPYVKQGGVDPKSIQGIDPELLYHRGGQAPQNDRIEGVAYAGLPGITWGGAPKQQAATGGVTWSNQQGPHLPALPKHPPAAEAKLLEMWDQARRHPVTALFEVISTGQHIGGAYINYVQQSAKGQEHRSMLKAIGDAIFNPTQSLSTPTGAQTREDIGVRAAEKFWFMPDDRAFRAWIDENVPKQWAPILGAVGQGGEQMIAQILSDPTSIAGVGEISAVLKTVGFGVAASKAAGGANALYQGAKAAGAAHLFAHLPQLAELYNKIERYSKAALTARPELHDIFTKEGYAGRLSIERAHNFKGAEAEKLDKVAVNDLAQARNRVRAYGGTQADITAMRLLNPEERLKELDTLRGKWVARNIANDTRKLAQANPGRVLKPGKVLTNQAYHKIPTQAAPIINPKNSDVTGLLQLLRNTTRSLLFLNPFPHGLRNVGALAIAANGISVVPRAIQHMVTGLPKALRTRMIDIGALPTYTQGYHKALYSYIPGFGKLWDKYINATQNVMERLEEGWRGATLEALDAKMGPSKDQLDELMKAQIVADRIGDPRNQAGFIRLVESIGGPYVAYRLGIVPKNMLRAMFEDPKNVANLVRPQVDIQRNRSQAGQAKNELEFGGPPLDIAELLTDPRKYIFSASTFGAIGGGPGGSPYEDTGPVTQLIQGVERWLLPPEVQQSYEVISGKAMPGPYSHGQSTYQDMSLADKLAASWMAIFAGYFKRQESPHTAKRIRSEIEKGTP